MENAHRGKVTVQIEKEGVQNGSRGELMIVPLAPKQQVKDDTKHPLQQIEENVGLKKRLEQLEKEEDIVRQRVENKESRRSSTQNEIYQLFGLYFVFQGVVISALYQAAGQVAGSNSSTSSNSSSKPLCKLWWLPFLLSLITSLAAIVATLHKLHAHGKIEYALELEKKDAQAIFKLIQEMRRSGNQFDIDKGPQHKAKIQSEPGCFACIFHPNIQVYTFCVTLVLVVFSAILLTACRLVLCDSV